MNASSGLYYDPYTRSIKCADPSMLAPGHTVTLSCSVVEFEAHDSGLLRPGKLLAGEVVEVIDPLEEEGKSKPAGGSGGLLTESLVSSLPRPTDGVPSNSEARDALLIRHRQLQSEHARAHRRLMWKQRRDRSWLASKVHGEEQVRQLEGIHEGEAVELARRQRDEMMELTSFAFDVLRSQPAGAGQAQAAQGGRRNPPSFHSHHSAPSAASAEDLEASRRSRRDEPKIKSAKPAVEAHVVVAPVAGPTLQDRIAIDRQKADEIKDIMRNAALSRTERQAALYEVKERYAGLAGGGIDFSERSGAMDVSARSSRGWGGGMDGSARGMDISARSGWSRVRNEVSGRNEEKRKEIRAVMSDKSLGREEKQQRMAEIQAKYARIAAGGDDDGGGGGGDLSGRSGRTESLGRSGRSPSRSDGRRSPSRSPSRSRSSRSRSSSPDESEVDSRQRDGSEHSWEENSHMSQSGHGSHLDESQHSGADDRSEISGGRSRDGSRSMSRSRSRNGSQQGDASHYSQDSADRSQHSQDRSEYSQRSGSPDRSQYSQRSGSPDMSQSQRSGSPERSYQSAAGSNYTGDNTGPSNMTGTDASDRSPMTGERRWN